MFNYPGKYLYRNTIMKNNSFILLKEEKERIKKLYEATTSSSSGAFNQPMAFSVPRLGSDLEVIDMENTFIGGDNIQDGSTEINLDIEDIAEFLGVSEEDDKKRMRKLHKESSTIKEQTQANSSLDSEGNETFTWTKDGEDNVIFKSASVEPNSWWTVEPEWMIMSCPGCNDRTKTDLDNYNKFTTHATQSEAYDSLGKQLNMDLSDYSSFSHYKNDY